MNELAERNPAFATPNAMLMHALQSGAPIELIRDLMTLKRDHEADEARKAFAAAKAAAFADLPAIIKTEKADFEIRGGGRKSYAFEDLGKVLEAVRPVLGKHGLSVSWRSTVSEGGAIVVTCVLEHGLGHREENSLPAPRDESGNKNYIQSIGSTLSYLQRYTLKIGLGLAASRDDDGSASKAGAGPQGTISPEQASQIDALLGELHDPKAREKVLRFAQAPSVGEIAAALHERTLTWLRSKKIAEIDAQAADMRTTQAAAEAAANPTQTDEAAA